MAAKSSRSSYNLSWLPVTIFAHLLVVAVAILVLVWLLQFREGLAFKSDNKQKIFNVYIYFLRNLLVTSSSCIVLNFSLGSVLQVHPLLMVIGFLLVLGEGKRYIINKIGSNWNPLGDFCVPFPIYLSFCLGTNWKWIESYQLVWYTSQCQQEEIHRK